MLSAAIVKFFLIALLFKLILFQNLSACLDRLNKDGSLAIPKLDSASSQSLKNLECSFGKRIRFKLKLHPKCDSTLRKQCYVRYQFQNDDVIESPLPFTDFFVSSRNIPATVASLTIAIVWYKQGNSKPITIFTKKYKPTQSVSEAYFYSNNSYCEIYASGRNDTTSCSQYKIPRNFWGCHHCPSPKSSFIVTVKGIGFDFESIPIDAKHEQTSSGEISKSIKATLKNIEPLEEAYIDWGNPLTRLEIYNKNDSLICPITPENIISLGGCFEKQNDYAHFVICFIFKDLPRPTPLRVMEDANVIKGSIFISVGFKVVNYVRSISVPIRESLEVKVNIPYQ